MLRQAGIRLPLITPGITYGGHVGADQKRVATPQQAWSAGANYLVLGRSILEAPDPGRSRPERVGSVQEIKRGSNGAGESDL
jgi:orotidine-5'-phosphate decarboxylase